MAQRAPDPEPESERETEPREQPEFVGYPQHYVLGIVPGAETAPRVAEELARAGLEDAQAFVGEDGLTALDSTGTRHGLFSTLMRAIEQQLAEVDHLGAYSQAIREGDSVVAVRADDDGLRERVVEVFRANDGRFVNYFGAMTVELLLR